MNKKHSLGDAVQLSEIDEPLFQQLMWLSLFYWAGMFDDEAA